MASTDGGIDEAAIQHGKEVERRMREREAARRAELEARRESGQLGKDPSEDIDAFWAFFNAGKEALAKDTAALVAKHAAAGGAASPEAAAALEGVTRRLKELQTRLADATLFLPPYDQRTAQSAVTELNGALEAARSKLVPRKRFAFSRRAKVTAAGTGASATATATGAGAGAGAGAGTAEPEAKKEGEDSMAKYEVADVGFEHKTGETLVLEAGQLASKAAAAGSATVGDFKLSHLRDCVVVLRDVPHAMRVDHLEGCHVYAGSVSGSVLLHECRDCVFVLGSRQIRIHTSHDCDYYLHVLSRPIIEHCTALRFAPFAIARYAPTAAGGAAAPDLAAQQAAAGLVAERAATMWQNVDDFGWHRTQASPNWSVLPEAERLCEGGSGKRAKRSELVVLLPDAAAPAAAGATAAGGAAAPAADDSDDDEL